MDALLPPGLDAAPALFLVAASMATSAVSGTFGIGGGVLLLALMAPLLPVAVLIPVHGLVQIGSNVGRAAVLARHAAWHLLGWFLAGGLLGVAAGAALVTDLPEAALRIAIGLFVIVAAVGRLPVIAGRSRAALAAGGALTTVRTMFVGATGPVVMGLYRQLDLERRTLVATTAVAMALQHLLKVTAFGALGFAFAAWLPLVAGMVVAGFLGTLLGTRLLRRLPEKVFRLALTALLVVLGANLVVSEAVALLGR